jgi:peptide/nickel transport system substrate-binding protein
MNIRKRLTSKLVILGVLFIVLIAFNVPGAHAQGVAASDTKTFYFATIQEPTTLDPAVVYDASDRATDPIYESLGTFRGSSSFDIKPSLAVSWDISPDYKVYTFHLRQGVTFHDGTPFNADAVKFSLTRMLRIGKGLAWAFKLVMGKWNETHIDVLDPYTVKITLKFSYPGFLGLISSPHGAPIISPSVMQHELNGDLGQAWATENTIGTGAYMLDHWTHKVEVVMVKFPNYWGGWEGNHVDRVVLKLVPEPSTQRLLLEQGDVDSATHITLDDMNVLRNNSAITIVESKGKSMFNFFVGMNTEKGLLKDIRIRQALSYAFDYEGTVKDAFKGFAAQSVGPMAASVPYWDKNVFVYHRDLNKAKELLAEAGYPNGGFTLTINYFAGQDWGMRILGVLTANLGELGIKLQPNGLAWSAMMDALMSQKSAPDMQIMDYWPDYPDPDSFLAGELDYWFWGSRPAADYFYYNSTVLQLLNAASSEIDTTKRAQLYSQIQDMVVANCPAIWVLDIAVPVPLRKEVHGFYYNALYELAYQPYLIWKEAVATPVGTSAITSVTPAGMQPAFPWEYIAGVVLAIVIVAGGLIAYRRTKSKTR